MSVAAGLYQGQKSKVLEPLVKEYLSDLVGRHGPRLRPYPDCPDL